jgi:hypothetical protein
MATESILNTADTLIRDRDWIWFFGPEILKKLIFCPPRVGHLRQCKSLRVGILLHYLDPILGHLQRFFAKMTKARQTGGGHPWNWLRHKYDGKVNKLEMTYEVVRFVLSWHTFNRCWCTILHTSFRIKFLYGKYIITNNGNSLVFTFKNPSMEI